MNNHYEVIIIGSGPAGMAAARLAGEHQATTLVLDEQRQPGGQIYRGLANRNYSPQTDDDSSQDGQRLINEFRDSAIEYVPGATIWHVSSEREVGFSAAGVSRLVTADEIIIATGAQERALPLLGWTLPGVMTVGAAQILLKESGVGCENSVFAGSGPLLYLAARQYMAAGIPIKALIDITPLSNYFSALKQLPSALTGFGKILQGLGWIREVKSSGIPLIRNVSNLRMLGEDHVTGLEYQQSGSWHRLDCEQVLLHGGVVPNINISLVAGCQHKWNERQACWEIQVNEDFQSNVPGIAVAGDAATIAGGEAAEHSGRLAALAALRRLDRIDASKAKDGAKGSLRDWKREMRVRPFLDELFRLPRQFCIPQHDDIIVCRCEEINAGEVRKNIDLGCVGPNQLKSFSRCGMGPCQGRFCGLTVSAMIADQLNKPITEVGYYRLRPPIKPIPLGELANLQFADDSSI